MNLHGHRVLSVEMRFKRRLKMRSDRLRLDVRTGCSTILNAVQSAALFCIRSSLRLRLTDWIPRSTCLSCSHSRRVRFCCHGRRKAMRLKPEDAGLFYEMLSNRKLYKVAHKENKKKSINITRKSIFKISCFLC